MGRVGKAGEGEREDVRRKRGQENREDVRRKRGQEKERSSFFTSEDEKINEKRMSKRGGGMETERGQERGTMKKMG